MFLLYLSAKETYLVQKSIVWIVSVAYVYTVEYETNSET